MNRWVSILIELVFIGVVIGFCCWYGHKIDKKEGEN